MIWLSEEWTEVYVFFVVLLKFFFSISAEAAVPDFNSQQESVLQNRVSSSSGDATTSGLLQSPRERNKSKLPSYFSSWASQSSGKDLFLIPCDLSMWFVSVFLHYGFLVLEALAIFFYRFLRHKFRQYHLWKKIRGNFLHFFLITLFRSDYFKLSSEINQVVYFYTWLLYLASTGSASWNEYFY